MIPVSHFSVGELLSSNIQWDTTVIADAATGLEEFYSWEQIQTIIKPHFYPQLYRCLMKIITVINCECLCQDILWSAEDDNFPKEGGRWW